MVEWYIEWSVDGVEITSTLLKSLAAFNKLHTQMNILLQFILCTSVLITASPLHQPYQPAAAPMLDTPAAAMQADTPFSASSSSPLVDLHARRWKVITRAKEGESKRDRRRRRFGNVAKVGGLVVGGTVAAGAGAALAVMASTAVAGAGVSAGMAGMAAAATAAGGVAATVAATTTGAVGLGTLAAAGTTLAAVGGVGVLANRNGGGDAAPGIETTASRQSEATLTSSGSSGGLGAFEYFSITRR